jgi:2-dehydropantoate 2-reductase
MPTPSATDQKIQTPHWFIIGAGAIGCLWAASLQQQNIRATLVVRDQQSVDDFGANGGLSLSHEQQTITVQPEVVSACAIDQVVERVIVATKAQHTAEALASIADRLTDNATILLLQNGMGQQQTIAEHYPSAELYCGISTDGVFTTSPFNIVHAGIGRTVIGRFPQQDSEAAELKALISQLPTEQLRLASSDRIEGLLFQKLLINTLINPLTAIHQCRNGDLLTLPEVYQQLEQLAAEVDQLTRALGLYRDIGPALALARDVATTTANNRSSMLQDRQAGRRTEIDYILGYLCALAEKNHVATPMCENLLNTVRQWSRLP